MQFISENYFIIITILVSSIIIVKRLKKEVNYECQILPTFNGDGEKTCRGCGKKLLNKGGMYEGVCSLQCSSSQLEYNAIPINILFIKRVYLHIFDEKLREKEIEKYITINKLNKEMALHKIEQVAKYVLKNKIDKLKISSNTIYYLK